jgi:hypothetical protein
MESLLLHCERESKKVKEYPAIKQMMAAIEAEYGSHSADSVVSDLEGGEESSRYFFICDAGVDRDFPCWTLWYVPRPTLLVLPCFAHLAAIWRR